VPDRPVLPNTQTSMLMGTASGAILGIGLVFALDTYTKSRKAKLEPEDS
jgi:uncharacterized protein involved in exopolysaccharide biosynthesis